MEISKELFKEIYSMLNHAEVFIQTREKMHPDGVILYTELLEKITFLNKNKVEKIRREK